MQIVDITIKNFMSIDTLTYSFPTNSVVEIVGLNKDTVDRHTKLPSSNGTGKSAFTLAIYQTLYNRNPKVPKIALLGNTVTKLGYTLDMTVSNHGNTYTVHNCRVHNKLIVTKNGKMVTSKINESLKFIQEEVVGLGYEEFVALTYISNKNILDIFDTTSKNMVSKFFNFNVLDTYSKTLNNKRIELNTTIRTLSSMIVHKPTSIVEDTEALERDITYMESELEVVNLKASTLRSYSHIISDLQKVADVSKANESGRCLTCKQLLQSSIETDLDNDILTAELTNYDDVVGTRTDLERKLLDYKRRLTLANSFKSSETSNTSKINKDIALLKDNLEKVNRAIAVIKQGVVHNIVLRDFVRTLNYNIGVLNNSGHTIKAVLHSGSIDYTVTTNGVTKDASTLSSGELTSVGLHIVAALLYTLSKLLGVSVNILVLDEAVSAVDSTNSAILTELLTTLKHKVGKTILLTQHHKEIDTLCIDETLTLVKLDGVTTVGAP